MSHCSASHLFDPCDRQFAHVHGLVAKLTRCYGEAGIGQDESAHGDYKLNPWNSEAYKLAARDVMRFLSLIHI